MSLLWLPSINIDFTLGDANTPAASTWLHHFVGLSRQYSASISTTLLSSYTQYPNNPILTGGATNGSAQNVLMGHVTPGQSYDFAMVGVDFQGNMTPVVPLAQNYAVPQTLPGNALGPGISRPHFDGGAGFTAGVILDASGNFVHPIMSSGVQDVITSGGGVSVNPVGGVTGNLPYVNHAPAITGVIDSSGNILSTEISGAKLTSNGALTNVDGASTVQGFTLNGQSITISGIITRATTSGAAGFLFGTTASGISLELDQSGVLYLYRYLTGNNLTIASISGITVDTNPHAFRLTIYGQLNSSGANDVWGTYDGVSLSGTEPSINFAASAHHILTWTGGAAGTLDKFSVQPTGFHYASMSSEYQTNFNSSGNLKSSTTFKASVPNALPNILSDVLVHWSATSTSVSIWLTNAAGTGYPTWITPDGLTTWTAPSAQCGTSTAPLAEVTGMTTGAAAYFIISYNPVAQTMTVSYYSATVPTDTQVAAALADGSLVAVLASASSTLTAGGSGGTIPGGGGHGIHD